MTVDEDSSIQKTQKALLLISSHFFSGKLLQLNGLPGSFGSSFS